MGEYDYPSNSDRMKTERPDAAASRQRARVESVAKGRTGASRKPKGGLFESSIQEVVDYIVHDVLVPTAKRAIYNSVVSGLGMMLGEKNVSSDKQGSSNPGGRVSYRAYYASGQNGGTQRQDAHSRSGRYLEYTEIEFDTRGDAELVLMRMEDILENFDTVSVAELCDLIGEKHDFTECKYGWTSLESASVRSTLSGRHILQLPRPVLL